MNQFKKDVEEGLLASPKRLPSKYFYDEIGDALFVKIMNMPEYYLTDAEMEIFQEQSEVLAAALVHENKSFDLIELGAGDGTKTVHLLRTLLKTESFVYKPIDISQHALDSLKQYLTKELPDLQVETQQGDYFEVLKGIAANGNPKSILFLGSNLGNMLDHNAIRFLTSLNDAMNKGDRLLLGLDQKKSSEIILPAYNDAAGITKEFNLNLLTRINREFTANFKVDQFEHTPEYDEEEGVARSFITSKVDQSVDIGALEQSFEFKKGERIHTEISRKYNREILANLLEKTNLSISKVLMDSEKLFADYLLEKT